MITIHEPLQIEVDGAVYDLTFTHLVPCNPDADDVWIAEVYDEQEDAYWMMEDPPQGATLGQCIDAVIQEATR